jgi:anti-sigma regulatory factor (Ser/Thr protein kinase)
MTRFRREVALDLPCVHRAVRIGRRVVQAFARTDGLADEEIERLMLVASELLANAVDHGGGAAAMSEEDLESDVRMQLRLVFLDNGWRLEVEDSGGGDAAEAAELVARAAQPDLEDERGRGLFLVRDFVDKLGVRAGECGLVFFASKELVGS